MTSEPCSCPIAGFCARHAMQKGAHYFRLCQDREDYRAKWDANRGPSQKNPELQIKRYQAKQERLERSRKHWEELHRKKDADAKWLAGWVRRIPQFGCACGEEFQRILREIPPAFGEGWFAWTVEVHNRVNAKLGKPKIDWETACQLWSWNINEKEVSYDDTT